MCKQSIFTSKFSGMRENRSLLLCFVQIFLNFFFVIPSIVDSLQIMMNMILFSLTVTCTIDIAFNLYVIELNYSLNFEAIIAFLNTVNMLGMTFVFYYLSECITQHLLDIGDSFYGSAWYRLADRHRRLLKMAIMRAQREFRLNGFGFFCCSLPIFSKVRLLLLIQATEKKWNRI